MDLLGKHKQHFTKHQTNMKIDKAISVLGYIGVIYTSGATVAYAAIFG